MNCLKRKRMPSIKHSLVQTNIAGTLFSDERFTTFIELSLDATSIDLSQFGLKAKDELVPDVCLYLDPPPVDEKLGSDMVRVGISIIILSGYALWIVKTKIGLIELPIFKLMIPVILYAIIGFYKINYELNGIIFSVVIVLLSIAYYKNYLNGYMSFFGQLLKSKLK